MKPTARPTIEGETIPPTNVTTFRAAKFVISCGLLLTCPIFLFDNAFTGSKQEAHSRTY